MAGGGFNCSRIVGRGHLAESVFVNKEFIVGYSVSGFGHEVEGGLKMNIDVSNVLNVASISYGLLVIAMILLYIAYKLPSKSK